MTWQDEDRHCDFRWILKCPFLLPYLPELTASFSDATVIWTHRDPVECIASACSLYEIMFDMTINTWTIDRVTLGQAVLAYSVLQIKEAEESIEKLSKRLNIIHVRYEDMIKNPKATCVKLCDKVSVVVYFYNNLLVVKAFIFSYYVKILTEGFLFFMVYKLHRWV
jgi:hypothetical protein